MSDSKSVITKATPEQLADLLAEAVGSEAGEKLGDRIGHYKLLEQIGQGGCGVVYVAEQEEPVRRRVALKVIKVGMDTRSVIARFEAERQALALMDHPNIAKVFDGGATEAGRPFFVMELVQGSRITDYCDQNNLSTAERLQLFEQACHAIQHAHQKGIIHRDIKPSNILVALQDGEPVPKVIDFGIAKAMEPQLLTEQTLLTMVPQFLGTPAYMSPEQAGMTGLDIDTRSDIYALGVLLYELLTGRTPFEPQELLKSGLDEMRRIIREEEPLRPSTRLTALEQGQLSAAAARRQVDPPKLIRAVRGDLDWIVMKCLEKDRTRRYETANGLAADVLRHLHSEPVLARPASRLYRFQRLVRRNKLAIAAAGAVTAALVLGIIVSKLEAVRATKAEQQATQNGQEARHLLYVANMNLAQPAWEKNNMSRLQELLEETREYPDRGFEWYYWQKQAHLAVRTFRGHTSKLNSVAISADGQRIVTASDDQTAKVWEAASGKELLTLRGHRGSINSVAFSPDGRRIVTGGGDETAIVWEAENGRALLTLRGHSVAWRFGKSLVGGGLEGVLALKGNSKGAVLSVAFSPNGLQIATGSEDRTAKLWEAASGKELLTLRGHRGSINSVAFSPDGKRIVTASNDNTAKVWEAASGKELFTLNGHGGAIWSAAFSPDSRRIVTGGADQTARVWEAASGKPLLTNYGPWILSVAFSPDGRRIVTGGTDHFADVRDATTGQELLTLKGHSDPVSSVAFSLDGRRIVTGSQDMTAKLWEAATPKQPLRLEGQSHGLAWVSCVAVSADGQRMVTATGDQTARVWDPSSGKELLSLEGHRNRVISAAFSLDGQRIVSGSWDNTAKVWEAASGKELLTLDPQSPLVARMLSDFASSGRDLLTLAPHIRRSFSPIYSVAFSRDGRRIVTGSERGTAKIWDGATGRELLTLAGHSGSISSVAFSPDGQWIVTASEDATAKVWDAASGRELFTLKGHSGPLRSVQYRPDGKQILTTSGDKTAKVWEAASGKELLSLNGHKDSVRCAAFSRDARRIVTGSDDTTVKVWEAASGRELLALEGGGGIALVFFSSDGERIHCVAGDTLKSWEAASPAQVAVWEAEEKTAAEHLATPGGEKLRQATSRPQRPH